MVSHLWLAFLDMLWTPEKNPTTPAVSLMGSKLISTIEPIKFHLGDTTSIHTVSVVTSSGHITNVPIKKTKNNKPPTMVPYEGYRGRWERLQRLNWRQKKDEFESRRLKDGKSRTCAPFGILKDDDKIKDAKWYRVKTESVQSIKIKTVRQASTTRWETGQQQEHRLTERQSEYNKDSQFTSRGRK